MYVQISIFSILTLIAQNYGYFLLCYFCCQDYKNLTLFLLGTKFSDSNVKQSLNFVCRIINILILTRILKQQQQLNIYYVFSVVWLLLMCCCIWDPQNLNFSAMFFQLHFNKIYENVCMHLTSISNKLNNIEITYYNKFLLINCCSLLVIYDALTLRVLTIDAKDAVSYFQQMDHIQYIFSYFGYWISCIIIHYHIDQTYP
eukprot:TRINITY_DN9501_c0_g1_i5.p1 TRINITY_DN9501_c0_g1~~TRINITY_DN9501_c0_g1_i5.p1  ORF type:complete len:201 (-),score=-16.18 TRINITY_DN9501_c0_g1_i5:100-702(-)